METTRTTHTLALYVEVWQRRHEALSRSPSFCPAAGWREMRQRRFVCL